MTGREQNCHASQAVLEQIEIAELILAVDDTRDAADLFKLPACSRSG